jgi:hypothetical protein
VVVPETPSYDNYLVGFEREDNCVEMNLIMKDGQRSTYKLSNAQSYTYMIPEQTQLNIRFIRIFYENSGNNSNCLGLQFLNEHKKVTVESNSTYFDNPAVKFLLVKLEEEERIVGFRAR